MTPVLEQLSLVPAKLTRSAQLLAVRGLAPLGHRQELSDLVHAGIQAEIAARRLLSLSRSVVWNVYDVARRSEVQQLREQLRAVEDVVERLVDDLGRR